MRRPIFILFLAAFCFVFSYPHPSPHEGNQTSRFDLLRAIWLRGSLQIDADHANTADKAVFQGHYYSDKAPGTALLALPAFAAASTTSRLLGISVDSDTGWTLASWVTCAGTLAPLAALGALALMLFLQSWISPRLAFIATLAICFGAAPFPYSTMLFPHAIVAAFICMAMWLLMKDGVFGNLSANSIREKQSSKYPFLAGTACGMAVACEYTAALVALGLFVFILMDHWRKGVWFALGSLPALLLIPGYHWACFGTPFTIAYGHQAVFKQMHTGLFGIGLPNIENMFNLLLSWERGLFVWTPFLILVLAGYPVLYERSKRLFWLTYLVPLFQVIAISGYYDIPAGKLICARYLTPVLPLLALPAALGLAQFPRIGTILAMVSVAFVGGATLVNPRLPTDVYNPLLNFYLPEILDGHFTQNLGHLIGLKGFWSLLPLLLVTGPCFWWAWRNLPTVEKTSSDSVK